MEEETNNGLLGNKKIKGIRRLTVEVGHGHNDNGHDQTVQGQSLSENQHQNHTDEDLLLLTTSANTGISSNTNRKTGSQARQTTAQSSSQMTVSVEARVVSSILSGSLDYGLGKRSVSTRIHHNDRSNQSVDTQNTSHNDGKHVSHDGIGLEHSHRAYTHSGLSSSVSRTKVYTIITEL